MFKLGELVRGDVLFGNGWRTEGIVAKEDAGISRDAIVVQLDNDDTVIMLNDSVERVK